jgi:glycosyltransferase A (GT-A) superfamily protein (DUF2064 family)
MTTLILICKEPIAGRVKTRLHPDVSYQMAAELAAASIQDTISVMLEVEVERRVLAFDGATLPAGTESFEVVPQVDGPLDERLAAIFDASTGPTVLIGMDTPQLTAADITPALGDWTGGVDAWFGAASDGGFWALGMREPRGDLIRGVEMSRDDTGSVMFQRLRDAGLRVGLLPRLTDVDTIHDAREVAAAAPATRFARTLARVSERQYA